MSDKTNYQKGYCLGFHEAKVACIHAIAIQYSEHGELVPNWLDIASIRIKENDND